MTDEQYEYLYLNTDIERRAKAEADRESKKLNDDEMFEGLDEASYNNGFYCGYIRGAGEQRKIDLNEIPHHKVCFDMLSEEEIRKEAEDSWLWFLYDNMDKDEVHDKDSYIQAFKDAIQWIKVRALFKI